MPKLRMMIYPGSGCACLNQASEAMFSSIVRWAVPLVGNRRVKDFTKADANRLLKDVMAGKTKVTRKTGKLRGKSIVRGGSGTASRTIGWLGGIMSYAIEAGIIETNPAHGIKKPKDNVRQRRLSEAEYRTMGRLLADAERLDHYQTFAKVVRPIGLPVVEFLEARSQDPKGDFVFPGERCAEFYGALPNQ